MKMRTGSRRRGLLGLSLVELLVMLGVIAVVAGILLPRIASQRRAAEMARRVKCVSNLKNVGLAFRIFATDNNDLFPARWMVSNGVELTSIDLLRVYGILSNELSTPLLLHCPSDTKRDRADPLTRFDKITTKEISYFTSLSADETMPQVILGGDRNLATNGVAVGSGFFAMATNAQVRWTKELHVDQGNLVMSDGSVQQVNSNRLKAAVADQGIETNYLVLP
jgi:type II secretory pathway pseudopilin PulG